MPKTTKPDRLEMQRRRITDQIWRREARQRKLQNAPLVGQFFRYRNSYSGGSPAWWLYVAATHMDDQGYMRGWSFQNDTEGRLSVEVDRSLITLSPDHQGYIAISPAEFVKAWADFLDALPTNANPPARKGKR